MDSVATPGRTLALVREKGLVPRKSRGQNFLVDLNIVRKIARAAGLGPDDTVVEIGPGLGALTQELAEQAGLVIAIEIDRDLISALKETLKDKANVRLVAGDALKVDFDELVAGFKGDGGGRLPTYKLVANLPYYITTPILMHLLTGKFQITELVLMVQAEVGYRMLALPGSKDYGSLSIVVQYYTIPAVILKVPRTVFYPRPEVDSLVVKLTRRAEPAVQAGDEDFFFRVVRAAFNQRRKTLLNALDSLGLERPLLLKAMAVAGVEPRRRGETLTIEEFANLSKALQQQMERR
ncbi:Ribosomal RNA adenine dimethylase [Moorella glycerini]|uniref:Ribosomal RNA small subunit methyltransferase A n=1 Tax=Neomoorella stamsii TaxID=1266720 RepID=A0A9X7P625_9FIRM|nr:MULTISPECIES: 16S rRNA (adenine(1518)-N(6)/adenine(1519)-N(6))-dimethyltransferase RsmA [Moorella]PRR72653.1 Ribosomal RNA small subunit methyltransferase A [Moorella stamsii]CEP67810.1 Ribosomal RNA adenine dimethylase [Moorella glycerini]